MSARRLSPVAALARHVVLLAGAVVMLAPFVWMLSTSIKGPTEIFSADLVLFPADWGSAVENYAKAFTATPLLRFLANGAIVTVTIFVSQVLIALPCAYALAKLRFKGRETLFALVLLCLMIPHHAVAIPLYLMLWKAGLLDTYAALIIPSTISVFGIFLMRQFFKTVPDDLVDAARLDGLSEFSIVWRVMLPTAVPALVAFGIFSVVAHWNDYFWPLIVVQSQDLFTPPLGVAHFRDGEGRTEYGPLMATAAVIIAPLVVAFLLAQRRFIEGITLTGLKG